MPTTNIAYFVSPHGFGHATRAAAVMEALLALDSTIQFHIFSTVPTWLFEETLTRDVNFKNTLVDIGLVQKTSLEEDLGETIQLLNDLLPYSPAFIKSLAAQVNQHNCRLVICDIAPLGIAVAEAATIPSLLIENFTWDWIYEGYLNSVDPNQKPKLAEHINYLRNWFGKSKFHIQTRPICAPLKTAHLQTGPISRKGKLDQAEIRNKLDIPLDARVVLITMGGIPWEYGFLNHLKCPPDTLFLIPGGSDQFIQKPHLRLLPHQSGYFHPDLINAADAVIGKVGYSTIAEVHQAGVPFGYIARPQFRESQMLVDFIDKEMKGISITEEMLATGDLESALHQLLSWSRIRQKGIDGADEVARFVIDHILTPDN